MRAELSTSSSRRKLREQLTVILTLGYAISDEEFYPGVRSLAVPVRDDTGVVAAVDLSVYEAALPVQDLVGFCPRIGATAERSRGYSGISSAKTEIETSDRSSEGS